MCVMYTVHVHFVQVYNISKTSNKNVFTFSGVGNGTHAVFPTHTQSVES